MRRRARGGTVAQVLLVVGVGGLALLGSGLVAVATAPWELDAGSPTAMSGGATCGPAAGARYAITVEGRRYSCGGADSKCGEEPVAIAYDPAEPARCRVAANVDRLSLYERAIVVMAAMFLAFGTAGGAYTLAERARLRALLGDGPSTAGAGALRVSAAALALAGPAALASFAAVLALLAGR